MNTTVRIALTCLALAVPAAFGAEDIATCAQDPAARGLPERVEGMRRDIDRIEATTDRSEQRILMDLHMKKIQEGMRELRRREATTPSCRVAMMHAMMEQMVRHQLAASDLTR